MTGKGPTPVREVDVTADASPPPHRLEPGERLQRAHQHRAAMPLLTRHGVEAPMDAVDEVHVGHAGRPVKMPRTLCPPRDGVAGRVVRPEIRLDLDDPTRRGSVRPRALEHGPEEVTRDQLGGAIVECR